MECGRRSERSTERRRWEEARRASAAMVVAGATDRRRDCECGQMGAGEIGRREMGRLDWCDGRWRGPSEAGWVGAERGACEQGGGLRCFSAGNVRTLTSGKPKYSRV
jgi:hypothetical protein